MEFLQNVCLEHLQLLMNTSAKDQANWTETVGGVVRTILQTDQPTDRLIPVYPPTNFVCVGIMRLKVSKLFW